MKYCRITFNILFMATFLMAMSPAGAVERSASTVVEEFHATLLGVMKNAKALGVKGRYERLAPQIDKAFNLTLTIRIAVGSYWRGADENEKARLVDAFRHLSISNYAFQFDGYSGQSFAMFGESPGPRGTVLVKTQIVRPKKPPVGLTVHGGN